MYVVSYIAFSVQALVAGLLTTHLGLRVTALGYGGLVALLALGTFSIRSAHASMPMIEVCSTAGDQ